MPNTNARSGFKEVKKAHELGALRNALGILSENYDKVRPEVWKSVTGLGTTETAKSLNLSRPSTYRVEVQVDAKLMKNILSVVQATDLAFELLAGNKDETIKWLMSPNTILFGDSPFQICMRGEGKVVIDWLNSRLGRIAGEAF